MLPHIGRGGPPPLELAGDAAAVDGPRLPHMGVGGPLADRGEPPVLTAGGAASCIPEPEEKDGTEGALEPRSTQSSDGGRGGIGDGRLPHMGGGGAFELYSGAEMGLTSMSALLVEPAAAAETDSSRPRSGSKADGRGNGGPLDASSPVLASRSHELSSTLPSVPAGRLFRDRQARFRTFMALASGVGGRVVESDFHRCSAGE